jgi:hypothetical protein
MISLTLKKILFLAKINASMSQVTASAPVDKPKAEESASSEEPKQADLSSEQYIEVKVRFEQQTAPGHAAKSEATAEAV